MSFVPAQDWFFVANPVFSPVNPPHLAALVRAIELYPGLINKKICEIPPFSADINNYMTSFRDWFPDLSSASAQEKYMEHVEELIRSAQIWRLAGWKTDTLADETVGMISIPGGGPDNEFMKGSCKLIPVPPLRGIYKHLSELSRLERILLNLDGAE